MKKVLTLVELLYIKLSSEPISNCGVDLTGDLKHQNIPSICV